MDVDERKCHMHHLYKSDVASKQGEVVNEVGMGSTPGSTDVTGESSMSIGLGTLRHTSGFINEDPSWVWDGKYDRHPMMWREAAPRDSAASTPTMSPWSPSKFTTQAGSGRHPSDVTGSSATDRPNDKGSQD